MPKKSSKNYCRICKEKKLSSLYQSGGYKILKCLNCGFGVLDPEPKINQLHNIYQEGYHDYLTDEDFKADAQKKLRFVKQFMTQDTSLLDFGCGLGHFLALAEPFCKTVIGFDISRLAAKKAKEKYNLFVKTGTASKKSFPKNSFEIITSFDVIEHIPDFKKTLNNFYHWLKPGGYLFMTTPSLNSWDARLLGKKWYGFTRIPDHVIYFTPGSIKRTLKDTGYKVKKITTWGFVRRLEYLVGQYEKLSSLQFLLKKLNLGKIKIYLPMTDMMVVAYK